MLKGGGLGPGMPTFNVLHTPVASLYGPEGILLTPKPLEWRPSLSERRTWSRKFFFFCEPGSKNFGNSVGTQMTGVLEAGSAVAPVAPSISR